MCYNIYMKLNCFYNQKDDWYTPLDVIKKFGPFDYDPATTKDLALEFDIKDFDTIVTDGLNSDWTKFNRIWVNPPFSKKFDFLDKAVRSCNNTHIYFLWPIESIITKRFRSIVGDLPFNIHIPDHRISFSGSNCPPFGSCVLYFGPDASNLIISW